MAWIVLVLAGAMEATWALALSASDGLRRLGPTLVFAVGTVCSLAGLAWAMRTLPTGTAYAVWTGVGAALTVVWSLTRGQEKASVATVVLLCVMVLSVVGLKAVA